MKIIIKLTSLIFPELVANWLANKFLTPRKFAPSKKEKELIKQVHSKTLKNGLKIWSFGEGEKILLVHGWEGRATQYWAFVPLLINAGYRVHILNGPAHGDSKKKQTNLADFARALIEVEKELGDFKYVVAHSFGAASTVIACHLGLKVKKLILIASPKSAQSIFNKLFEMLSLSNKARKKFQAIVEEKANFPLKKANIKYLGPSLNIKALLIHDIDDKEVPFSEAQEVVANWKEALLFSTKGLGHRRILQSETVVRETVRFIKKI